MRDGIDGLFAHTSCSPLFGFRDVLLADHYRENRISQSLLTAPLNCQHCHYNTFNIKINPFEHFPMLARKVHASYLPFARFQLLHQRACQYKNLWLYGHGK